MKHLVWLLFLPGFLCNPNPLTIRPDSLMTWKGSCVLIPCKISQYKGVYLRNISLLWYFQPFFDANRADYFGTLLYNSSARNDQTRSQTASQPQANFMGNLENKDCSLKISQVRIEDTGIYGARLIASYNSPPVKQGKWFLNATVNVAESPPDPRMDISPKDNRESWTTVTCSVLYHCLEELLRLTISGLELRRLSSQKMTTNNGVIQTFVSFQATWEDHGKTVTCSLSRQNWTVLSMSTMQLDVKHEPKDARLIVSPGRTIREGEALSLECATNSSSPEVSEYLWYKDDQLQYEWQNRKKNEFETKGDRHSGGYRCEAKNSIGTGSSNIVNIDVQYGPKDVQLAIENDQLPIKEKDTVTLNCSFGHSNPRNNIWYKWYRANSTLSSKGNLLTFPANVELAGDYRCEACNTIKCGSSPSVTVDIHFAPKEVKVMQQPRTPIYEGDYVNLRCDVAKANPKAFRYIWYKDGVLLHVDYTTDVLTIDHVTYANSGLYRCEATNRVATSHSQQVMLYVHSHLQDTSAPAASGPQPTAQGGNQILHSCKELRPAVIQLADRLQKELLQIRQKTCEVPRGVEKP